ncbi:MAG TPA: IPT/TIG domain-containing protein [Haliangiales bacterium]|nr:IPT/TIG domain-containing protein [Haliangiales bacterium]
MRWSRLLLPLLFLVGLLGCEEKKDISVSEIFPKRGPFMGGDPVTIKGTGFSASQGITIYFGKKKARPPVIKGTDEIIVEPPAGEPGASVDVEIEFADSRRLKLEKAYSYYDPTKKLTEEPK